MRIRGLIFDFDGVILDSLNVKTRAFYEMYLPYGKEIAEKAAEHHLEYGGMSRFEKFRIYHKEFLGIDIDEKKVQELATEFSTRVLEGVIASPEVPGVRDFLEKAVKTYKMWIITGTPAPEIQHIAKATRFTQYFRAIYGSPEKKEHWAAKILADEGMDPAELIFIGDATTDYEAALHHGIHFVLREHDDNTRFFTGKELVRIRDFIGFEKVIGNF